MRSSDIKIHRTDGSTDTPNEPRLAGLRTAIQAIDDGSVASQIMLLHDHKGSLTVHHFGTMGDVEKNFLRTLWELCGEPRTEVTFAQLEVDLGVG